jgi:hypothetical protein
MAPGGAELAMPFMAGVVSAAKYEGVVDVF